MNRIDRIQYYENLLNESVSALKRYSEALDAFVCAQQKISELEAYYTGDEWKEDFEASERKELPEDLPCGVLSEDGIDHLLDDNRELLERTGTITDETANAARDT